MYINVCMWCPSAQQRPSVATPCPTLMREDGPTCEREARQTAKGGDCAGTDDTMYIQKSRLHSLINTASSHQLHLPAPPPLPTSTHPTSESSSSAVTEHPDKKALQNGIRCRDHPLHTSSASAGGQMHGRDGARSSAGAPPVAQITFFYVRFLSRVGFRHRHKSESI